MPREIKFFQAINEAIDLCMAKDASVYIMGLGVPDPKGVFGSTLGLEAKYGSGRVMDMPASENAMTGVAIGSALVGMRPIMVHQRVDFAVLAIEQIVNQAANWHYMFGGRMSLPLVVRMVIGRGWGQGAQHAQSLQAWFAHIPGLKVVMPATSYDAKGLLVSSIEENNPVIFMEHRWLYDINGDVPQEIYRVPLGKARVAREGSDITFVAASYMVREALQAAEVLKQDKISAEVIDLRTIKPMDEGAILASLKKTGRLLALDGGWRSFGVSAEIVAYAAEKAYTYLKCAPQRLAFPDVPLPTSWALANYYYPKAVDIVNTARNMLGFASGIKEKLGVNYNTPQDLPDKTFSGPF